jgi:hypothetical protein
MSDSRHGRACPSHLSVVEARKGVDARHKAGHDGAARYTECVEARR